MPFKCWPRQIFCGMCMGAADIIPGISGGTVAFIMGFYEDLINSIKSFRFPLKNFAWDFLLATILGVVFSMIFMVQFITALLDHEVYRIYLYSGFLGLILASVVFCAKQVSKWHVRYLIVFAIGAFIAYTFTGTAGKSDVPLYDVRIEKNESWTRPIANYDASSQNLTGVTEKELSAMLAKGAITRDTPVHLSNEPVMFLVGNVIQDPTLSFIDLWMIFAGMVGISALLLPGVSGSYMLTILGVYPVVIGALADLVHSFKALTFDVEASLVLANLGAGIILGAIVFSRVISWLLSHYHQTTLSLLTGFLVGSLHVVWPFWSYEYLLNPLQVAKGPKLHAVMQIFPTGDALQLTLAALFVIVGFTLVFVLESVANKKPQTT